MRLFLLILSACLFLAFSKSHAAWADDLKPAAQYDAEIHVKLCPSNIQDVVRAYGLDADAPKTQTLYFLETPALALYRSGLILRVQKPSGEAPSLTVKILELQAASVGQSWFSKNGFKCEEDDYGEKQVQDCSLTENVDPAVLAKVLSGQSDASALLSKNQFAFLDQYAAIQPDWSDVRASGPIPVTAWTLSAPAVADPLDLEYWKLPNAQFISEISLRTGLDQADSGMSQLSQTVSDHGVPACPDQMSKTEAALRALEPVAPVPDARAIR